MTKTNKIVAIGDVHGCYTKLREAIEPYKGSGAELIFLGDLIDRSPEPDGDLNVLKYVKDLQDNAEEYGLAGVTVIRGNHEQYLLNLKTNYNDDRYRIWECNGGNPELYARVDEFLPWIDSFKVKAIRGNYLFVHAGIRPGVPLRKQSLHDMLWIREEFLDNQHGLPYVVVHGHTVVEDMEPEVLPYRIGLDTGACFGGPLTAYEIDISVNTEAFEQALVAA